MKSSKMWIRICNIACALLLVALVVFQFLPFWTMPACETCQVRCELSTDKDCPACAITKEWCVVPTSCVCETKCSSKSNALETCPICTEKWRLCVAESRVATTDATVDPTEATVESTEPAETAEPIEETADEKKELVLTPVAPIPENREGVTVSIQEYVWLPTFDGCIGVTEYFESEYDDFKINDIILMPALTLILAAAMVFFGALKNKPWACLLAFIAGLLATVTYLTQPIFQAGIGWQTHLYISIAVLVVAAIPVIVGAFGILRKLLNKKK